MPFCIRYGCQLAWVCVILHQGWSSVGVFVSFCIKYGRQIAWVCVILHQVDQVWSSVGVCLCHFASGMVVSWRVCVILHQVWSSLACICVILHQQWSAIGVYFFILHYIWSSVGVIVPFCIRYGPQLVCFCQFVQVSPSIGVGLRHFASGSAGMVAIGVCLCHFASGMVGSSWVCVGMVVSSCGCAILHYIWSSVGVIVPFCIRYDRQLVWLCPFALFVALYIRYNRQLAWVCVILHQGYPVWSLIGLYLCHFDFRASAEKFDRIKKLSKSQAPAVAKMQR